MRYLVGIGNYMALDDSIGLRIAETIAEEGLEAGFHAIELGGNLIDLVHYLSSDAEAVLIVDTACMGLEPGEYTFFTPEQVESRKELAGFSTHEGDLLKVLALADTLNKLPPITIMGIEPADMRGEAGLSPSLEARFREYIAAAVAFITPTPEQLSGDPGLHA
ncbi:MAG: hydrogenase maturation protease [Coriobacteriia bacterium]